MKLRVIAFTVTGIILSFKLWAQTGQTHQLQLNTVDGGIMQYYVSLPYNWTADKKWPVVVIVEAAEKEFKENALRFINARDKMPFIIVSPIVVTNGNYGRRNPALYPYSVKTWDKIDAISDCKFDMDGVLGAIKDVTKNYNGEDKFFITGFEAGTHLVWAMIFEHPEMLRAAAPVAGNYIGRCVDNVFSNHSSRVELPIRGFTGELDTDWKAGGRVYYQWQNARQAALSHGYKNISETVIGGKAHVPLPNETLSYFYSLYHNQ